MKRITWLILILVIVSVMLIVVNTGITTSYFTDAELSIDDTLNIGGWSITLPFSDGFEGTPWDLYWDGNGTTDWQPGAGYGGSTYSAEHASGDTYLTSDDLDASGAGSTITVSFWFKIKLLNKGPLNVLRYNGTSYDPVPWYDLVSYAGGVKNTWIEFNETIPDSLYFISNFSIRFDGSTLTTNAFIDDVLIQKN